MTALYSVILAGGLGSRLWPLSREVQPKQMFKAHSDNTLFQNTFLRLAGIADDKNIITSTNVKHLSEIKEQLKQLQEKFCREIPYKVVTEPEIKNTAPALAMAVKYIQNIKTFSTESPVIISVPSDHIIPDREVFVSIIEKGINLAKNGYIVSFSTLTDMTDNTFGYIKTRKNAKLEEIEPSALKVSAFLEKPSKKDMAKTLKGKYYVNTGIYMYTAETFMSELKKHAKDIYKIINKENVGDSIPSVELSAYEEMPDISIDNALMEKTSKLVTVPFETYWKDIGSWDAIYEISDKDENGNLLKGNVVDVDSENSLVYSNSKLVATLGLKNKIVVETEDALLVCNRENSDSVQKIYKKLDGKNAELKRIHKTAYRPWGCYTVLEEGDGFLTKCITVNPNAKLSLQKHFHRSEHWIVLEGDATVVKGEETLLLHPGESIDIGVDEVHSLQNFGKEQVKILEVQQGNILDENDIVRLQDMYGRV